MQDCLGLPYIGRHKHRPMKGNRDSGIREIFAFGIRHPRFWNPEYCLRNPKSHQRYGIQNPSSTDKYWNPVPEIWNRQPGTQNARLSWITSHRATQRYNRSYHTVVT